MYPTLSSKLNGIDLVKMIPGILIQSIGFFCSVSSVKYGKVTITSMIKQTRVIVTFLLGIVFLKEGFTILQLLFSILLVILSILVGKKDKKEEREEDKKIEKALERKAILYSYGFVIFNGTSNFLNKLYVNEYQDPMYVVFNYAIIAIFGVLVYCFINKKWDMLDIRKIKNKKYFFLQSGLDSSSSIFNRFALLTGNVSIISILGTSSIAITLLASRIILKEKLQWKKYILIIGIFLCVLCLSILK